jgi:hypothetical protein
MGRIDSVMTAGSDKKAGAAKSGFHSYPFWAPKFWHGMRVGLWLRLLFSNKFTVALARLPVAIALMILTPFNDLLYGIQCLLFGRKIQRAKLPRAPLFIIGHWRSGTTLLHELLSLDDRWASPTTYQCFAPWHFLITQQLMNRFGNFLIPDKRPMDNMKAGWQLPQEDEFALMNLGCKSPYLRIAFPRNGFVYQHYLNSDSLSDSEWKTWSAKLDWFLRALTTDHGKPLILKSPTHTGRIGRLHQAYPESYFIHISRDPRKLFPSTVRLWQSLDMVQGLQYPMNDDQYEALVLDSFQRMYEGYLKQKDSIPAGQLIEIRYEDLIADPLKHLEELYKKLGWDGFEQIRPKLEERLQQDRDYQVNRHNLSDSQEQKVKECCEAYMKQYGYWN